MELEFEMANGTEVANGDSTVASADNDENANLLSEAVRSLPAQAVKDLSSIGVCIRCICRLFGIHEGLQPCASLILSNLCEVVGKETGLEEDQLHNGFTSHEGLDVQHPSQDLAMEMRPCSLCLGILQFIYCNDKDELITRDSANGFALEITKEVKREFYQFENFSLEVSLPPLVVENEEAVR